MKDSSETGSPASPNNSNEARGLMLVTGASGFLGGSLARRLAADGYRVRVLVRPTSDASGLQNCKLEIVYGALEDASSLERAVRDVCIIYHCAALSADWGRIEDYRAANVLGVQNLLAAAAKQKTLRRFMHVSTTDVYGYPVEPCDESAALRDVGFPYNSTKVAAEHMVWAAKHDGMPVTVVRPASLYGPGSKDFVATMAELLQQGMMLTLDRGASHAGLMYIDNCVESLVRLAESRAAQGKPFNLRDPYDITWRQYIDRLAAGIGARRAWLNLPSWLAFPLAWLLEQIYGALHIDARPLLTRHAVRVLHRTQGYAIDALSREIDCSGFVPFDEGMRRTVHWLAERNAQSAASTKATRRAVGEVTETSSDSSR